METTKKQYSIPLYENGIKTEYTIDFEEGDEKWQILMKMHNEIPIMVNVATENKMKTNKNKWRTDKCGRCGEAHESYTGKLDTNGIEYVICENTNKRINVNGEGKEGNTFAFVTKWVKI